MFGIDSAVKSNTQSLLTTLGSTLLSVIPFGVSGCVATRTDSPESEPEITRVEREVAPAPQTFRVSSLTDLDSEDPDIRLEAARYLGQNFSKEYAPKLLDRALNDPLLSVRTAASGALARNREESAVEPFIEKLYSEKVFDLQPYALSLAFYPTESVAEALLKGIKEGEFGCKEPRDPYNFCGEALARMGEPGLSKIRALLSEREPAMQVSAAVALSRIKDQSGLGTLLTLAKSDDSAIVLECLLALPNYSDSKLAIAALKDALYTPETALAALRSLTACGPESVCVLAPFADPESFEKSGFERPPADREFHGITYGDLVMALLSIKGTVEQYGDKSEKALISGALKQIEEQGIIKLVTDLTSDARKETAKDAVHALAPLAPNKFLGHLHFDPVKEALMQLPLPKITELLLPIIEGDTRPTLGYEARNLFCDMISRPVSPYAERLSALTKVVSANQDPHWGATFLRGIAREPQGTDLVQDGLCLKRDDIAGTVWERALSQIERARYSGIKVPLRWDEDILDEIIKNRAATQFDGRKIVTLIYTTEDHNGAFGLHNEVVRSLINTGYCVMYFEASNEDEVIEGSKRAISRPNSEEKQLAHGILWAAHSKKTKMQFGAGESEENLIDIGDKEQLIGSGVAETLAEDGQIILVACSVGEGRDSADNVANMLRAVFPQAKAAGIWSSEVPTNVTALAFDTLSGELLEVKFTKEGVYRP